MKIPVHHGQDMVNSVHNRENLGGGGSYSLHKKTRARFEYSPLDDFCPGWDM